MNNKRNYLYLMKIERLVVIGFLIVLSACVSKKTTKEEFCTEADFVKMDKIDAHCHIDTKRPAFMEQAVADNFRIITIDTDAPVGVTIDEQQNIANFQRKAFPGNLAYLTTFSMKGWGEDDWLEKTMAYLKESFKKGAIGVKVWKNIGMVEKDKEDNFIMIDDPKFDPIFNYLAERGIPVCGHLGEPKNCWLPTYNHPGNRIKHLSTRKYRVTDPEDLPPTDQSDLNDIVIRYADILLSKAEALIETNGSIDEAVALMNQIRKERDDVKISLIPTGISREEAIWRRCNG